MRRLAEVLIPMAIWMVAAGSVAQDQSGSETKPETATTAVAAPDAPKAAAEGSATGDTHVRIVRLSSISGKVGMDRGIGRGIEQTMLNMPVVEGVRLGTAEGFAEVEFEDGSTLRLAPNTVAKFPLLVLRNTGVKASTVEVELGTVYVNLEKSKDTEFTLAAGKTRIHVNPGTHLRLGLTDAKATLAVFDGNATVEGGQAPIIVAKKQTLTTDTTGNIGEVAKGVNEGSFDAWDKQSQKYHERFAKRNALLASSPQYGISDLNYYGGFFTSAGCGTMWQPYFVSASWSPYSVGARALYQGGYTWVSPYPWGWLPYHTGSWNFCPGRGWGWQPGSGWNGLVNIQPSQVVVVRNPIDPAGSHRPVLGVKPNPPRQPVEARTSFVVENGGSVPRSELKENRFVFQKDSAGLGVPRGSLGNLHGISGDVEHHGFANREVYAAPVVSPHAGADGREVTVPVSLHRGPAPDANGDGRFAWKNAQADANGRQRTAQGATPSGGQNSAARNGNAAPGGSPSHTTGGGAGSSGSFHGGGGASGSGAGSGGSFHGGGGGAPTGNGGNSGGGRSSSPAPSPH